MSLKSVIIQASITSADGVPAATPLPPLVESARSATLTDVREADDKKMDSDFSSDSDTDAEENSPTQVEQPSTRIVPYHQMAPSLTPMQSLDHHIDTSDTIKQVAAAPPSLSARPSDKLQTYVKPEPTRKPPPPPPPPHQSTQNVSFICLLFQIKFFCNIYKYK